MVLSMSQSQRDYLVSCNCMVNNASGHKEQLATVPRSELGGSGVQDTQFLVRVWRESHHPPLDTQTVSEAMAHRWVWVE